MFWKNFSSRFYIICYNFYKYSEITWFFLFDMLFGHKIFTQDGFLFTKLYFKLVILKLKLLYCIYI